jgi:hypothetical protein
VKTAPPKVTPRCPFWKVPPTMMLPPVSIATVFAVSYCVSP